ncbi:hypothetical protein BT69DRAFT_1261978 [Atractiella rhizophila]|nr:hypothetical protein BT69DRAFT_1261978 [Atractiella rhizophila]
MSGGFSFGSFEKICEEVSLIVCPLLGTGGGGIEPTCYSRNVEIGNTLIFQPATSFIHIVALIMVTIMVFHIRSKYTAVGRKEIVLFFYLYAAIEILAAFLDSGIIPTSSPVYEYFAAAHTALICATFWCLLLNGFVGFQFAEDGTPASLWTLRISSFIVFGITFFVAIATFKNIGPFSPEKGTGIWILLFIFDGVCAVVYIVSQFILVLRTLEDRWPIGDIAFGTAFFAAGLVLTYGFSVKICDFAEHYIDGLFFGNLLFLLSVMMVYKYWDSITKEDLEFSVGSKLAQWDVKDPLLAQQDDYSSNKGGYNY